MKLSDEELRALWRTRSPGAAPRDSACLDDSEWTRLLSKDASPDVRARAATHIASCAACAEEYRLLQPLREWGTVIERVLSPPDQTRASGWAAWRTMWPSSRIAVAVAVATLLLLTNGVVAWLLNNSRRESGQLGLQLAENSQRLAAAESSVLALQDQLRSDAAVREQRDALQRQQQAQLTAPQLGMAIVDLAPRVAGTVRGSASTVVTTGPDAPAVTLVLNFPPLASRTMLEVRVVDASRQVLWTGRTERDRETDALTLTLPAPGFPAGEYAIHVLDGVRGGAPLTSYSVVIRHGPGIR